MDDRELAVVCTHVMTAIKKKQPEVLADSIAKLEATPWNHEVVQVLKAVTDSLDRIAYVESRANSKKK
jgi:hypothetical protein